MGRKELTLEKKSYLGRSGRFPGGKMGGNREDGVRNPRLLPRKPVLFRGHDGDAKRR